jgi:pseudouridine synthase
MRINRALAKLGYGSRRSAEQLVRTGKVEVNGEIITDLAAQVDPECDRISVAGRKAPRQSAAIRVIAFYKPRGILSTWKDERGRRCLGDYFPARGSARMFAVGRLDRDSEGLLLVTNDGDLAHKLTHPSFEVPRTYEVTVAPLPDAAALKRLSGATRLSDGPVQPESVRPVATSGPRGTLQVTLSEGRHRVVRRMLAAHGFEVLKLRRTRFGSVSLGTLKPGRYRELASGEIKRLRG